MKKSLELTYSRGESSIYDIKGNKNNFALYASSLDKGWRTPGERFLSLVDDGNGITVVVNDLAIRLDYMQSELLRLALKINNPDVQLSEITKTKFKGLK